MGLKAAIAIMGALANASLALRNCLALVAFMILGAYVGLLISHALFQSPSETALSNFALSVHALLKSWTSHVTVVDESLRSEIET